MQSQCDVSRKFVLEERVISSAESLHGRNILRVSMFLGKCTVIG
jgi:hypothetical protein